MDLGSSKFKKLRLPKPAILVGAGISGYEAGEMWHLLDAQFGIPVSLIEKGDLSRERLQGLHAPFYGSWELCRNG